MTEPSFTITAAADSPVAQRVALALAVRGTALDWRRPRRGTARDRLTIRDDSGAETSLGDSIAMLEAIEDLHPDRPLHPRDPLQRARHRELILAALTAQDRLETTLRARTPDDLDLAQYFLGETIAVIEAGVEPPPAEPASTPTTPTATKTAALHHPLSNLDVALAPLLWRILVLDRGLQTHLGTAFPRSLARGRWLMQQPEVAALLDNRAAQEFLARVQRSGAALSQSPPDWSAALGPARYLPPQRPLSPRPVQGGRANGHTG